MMDNLDRVKEQLLKMSESEKDAWIISYAKQMPEYKQNELILSLSGEKKIIDMPTSEEIDKFFRQVSDGKIYIEYETHYYEFDDDGRYMDDYKIWYLDPFDMIPFMEKIFVGCHKLLCIEEYQQVFDLLYRIFELQFSVEASEDSEDCPPDETISLKELEIEGMLNLSLSNIGMDWIMSYIKLSKNKNIQNKAKKILEMLQHPVCYQVRPEFLLEAISEEEVSCFIKILEKEIEELQNYIEKKCKNNSYSLEEYRIRNKLERDKGIKMELDIRN